MIWLILEKSKEEEFCLVDEENEDIEVHYVGQERKAFIKKEAWQKLSPEDRSIWGRLSREGKMTILNNPPDNSPQKREDRTINSAESQSDNHNTIEKCVTTSYQDNNSLLDNLRKGRDTPQSDIRKVMAEADVKRNSLDCNTARYTVTSW